MSVLGEKTSRIPDDSEQTLQVRDYPKTSFQYHTFERQLRSTKDIEQLHTDSYIVPFLLSFFSGSQVKFVFSKNILYGTYHFISNIKCSKRD